MTGPSDRVGLAIGLAHAVGGCAAGPGPSAASEPRSSGPAYRAAGEAAVEALLAIAPAGRYELLVEAQDRYRATCTLTEAS